ncbi:MAG TPA: type I pullulanase, partial [Eubacteriaceae bacterium]|nr:type I pullulanase [Eubacteriaceae bacterium]
YDPEHYNVPEGSYASRPSDPKNRIKELKTLIMILHNEGFQVIMDVVYNHTYRGKTSHLNLLASDYYYRLREDGSFSDGAGCGNELATEKEMVRKMIIDSLVYWMEEYKVDGFRFDLMALIDIETISKAVQVLRMIKKDVLIYGEPWTADQTVLKDECMTRKGKQQKRSFAFFNDEYRDAIKGDSDGIKGGFVQGEGFLKKEVEKGIAGSIYYDDERIGFTATPQETVNYVNSHDNLILYDKMAKMFPHQDGFIERINKMAFFLLFVSQGIPFIHAGNEFLRSKSMVENSYRSGIEINKVNWEDKLRHYHFFVFFKELIALRKAFPEFRLRSAEEIRSRLLFLHFNPNDDRLLGFVLRKTDDKGHLLVLVNAKDTPEIIPTQNIRKELKSHEEVIGEKCYYQLVFDVEGMKEKEYHPDQCYSHALKVAAFGFSVYLIHESDETRWE